jgi:hypothetical protein
MDGETEAIRRETVAIRAKTKAWQEEMAAMRDKIMEADRNAAREEVEPEQDIKTMAYRETMKARLEEKGPTSVETKPEVTKQNEVPNADAVVKPEKGRKRWHKGKEQAAEQRGELKKQTRDCGSRTKLAAACRKVSRCATVA